MQGYPSSSYSMAVNQPVRFNWNPGSFLKLKPEEDQPRYLPYHRCVWKPIAFRDLVPISITISTLYQVHSITLLPGHLQYNLSCLPWSGQL